MFEEKKNFQAVFDEKSYHRQRSKWKTAYSRKDMKKKVNKMCLKKKGL